MQWTPNDYRLAALERLGEANALRRADLFGIAMYVSGLAAECMLRAHHHRDRPFDERHDVARLFQACDLDHLGDRARLRLRDPIQTIHSLWSNAYRFAHATMVVQNLHRLSLDRDVPRNADPLKAKCIELFDACSEVVTVGEDRWTKI